MRLDPRYPWAYAMLANILFNLNRFKESLARSVEGLRFDPLHESLFRWKGWAEHKLSEHDDALATANEGLKHHPNSHLLMNLIGCIKWTLAQKKWGLKRLRLHREADVALRDSMRLDPGQPAYRDNLRGNAVSCRQHVAFVCLPVLMILGLVVPILVLCANVLHDIDPGLTTGIGCGALLIAFVVCGVAPISMAAYAAPLSRWNIPEVPLTDKERWQGRAGLYLIAFFFLLPYLLAAALLFG
jgi:tetratricopeptide (TPR) repeat protein